VDRKRGLQGVLLTLVAWGCWQGMETVPDNSVIETILLIGGYVLVGLALVALFFAFRNRIS
jgi:hypothetical protein